MTLKEILQLEMKPESIRQINLFISHCKPDSYDYLKALSYKCLILHRTGKTKEALKLLLQSSVNFKNYGSDSIVAICDVIIQIFIDVNESEQALKYINIKNDNLKEIDKDKYTLDLIKYNDLINNSNEVKKNIIIYLNHDIDDFERMYALKILASYQYKDKEFDRFYDTYDKLEELYVKNYDYKNYEELMLLKAKSLREENRIIEVKDFLNKFLSLDFITHDNKIVAATILLNVYMTLNEFRRAMILESEYHDEIECNDKMISYQFSLEALKLYKELNNKVSVQEYEEAIKEYEEAIKEERKNVKRSVKKTNYNIVFDNETIDVNETTVEVPMKNEPSLIEVSSNYSSIEQICSNFNALSDIRFRDLFRNYGILIEEKFSKCEIVIALNINNDGYHYKVGRVYEKKFSDDYLANTASNELINNSSRLFLIDVKSSLFDKDIITQKPYNDEFKTLIGFKLYRDSKVVGSIIYVFFTSEFKDKLIYESLKMLTNMLNVALNQSINRDLYDADLKAKDYLVENSTLGVKFEQDHEISLNAKAQNLLGVKTSSIMSGDFVNKINSTDARNYIEVYSKIYNENLDKACLFYHINDRYIKESIIVKRDNITEIYSTVEDITEQELKEKRLVNMAYNDPYTKLKTRVSLYEDIRNVLDDKKFSLVLVNVVNFKMYFDIYGYSFTDELILAIGRSLLEILESYKNINAYHLDNDKFMILFKDKNDIRTINRITNEILKKLKIKLNDINHRVSLKLKAGGFRYTKALNVTDVNKIVWYTSDALMDAVNSNEDIEVAFFDEEKSKIRFREYQIGLHISEAIDSNQIKIKYKQVVNLKENTIDFYYASLNLINFSVPTDSFKKVVEKRDLKELVSKYLIMHSIMELKNFYEENKTFYNVIIPVYQSVLNSNGFISYLLSKLEFFKVPNSIIMLHIINDINSNDEEIISILKRQEIFCISNDFDYCILNKVSIFFCDLEKYNLEVANSFKSVCKSVGIDVFGFNVSDNLDDCMSIGINIIFGNAFKREFTISELISNFKNFE